MLVGGFTPRSMEADLGLYIISVCDDDLSLDVVKEQVYGFVVVANILLLLLLDILRVDNLFNGGDYIGVDGLLEVILMSWGLLILL